MKTITSFPKIQSAQNTKKISWEELCKHKFFIAEVDYYLPPSLFFIPVGTKESGQLVYQLGKSKGTFCDVDLCEIESVGGKILHVWNALIFTEEEINPFSSFVGEKYKRRVDAKEKGDQVGDLMEKNNLNSLYGKTVCKDITEKYSFISMEEGIKGIKKNGLISCEDVGDQLLIRRENEQFFEEDNCFPSLYGIYILAHSRKIVNNAVRAINGFNELKVHYTDTDSLYIDEDSFEILRSKGFVGNGLGQGKSETAPYSIDYAIFLGSKQKFIKTSDGKTHITFKGVDRGTPLTKEDFILMTIEQDNGTLGEQTKNVELL